MKKGLTLHEMALEIDRQRRAKEDFTGSTSQMTMTAEHEDGEIRFALGEMGEFAMLPWAHRQVGQHTNIPARYYDRMLQDAPGLLTKNVNHWFNNAPAKRLVRTLDGQMRAFLSDRYRPMDNAELAEAVLPALQASGASVHSAQITDTKLYIKAVVDDRSVVIPPPTGENGIGYRREVVVQPGIVITNSEVGAGAVAIQPAIHELACLNMAVWAQDALRKAHLGSRIANDNDNVERYLSDQSRHLADLALWSQVQDIAKAATSGDLFEDLVSRLTTARSNTFAASDSVAVIEKVCQTKGLNDTERDSVLGFLIDGGELSQYAVQAAITEASQYVESYERASELEIVGGDIIALSPREWSQMTTV